MHARVQTDNYSLTSTGLAWVWTQALMDFKVGDCQRSPLVLKGAASGLHPMPLILRLQAEIELCTGKAEL